MIVNIITFLMTLIIIELYYKIFVLKKNMKYNPNKVPTEVNLLIKKYKLDMKKVNYYYLMKSIGRVNALTIAIIMFIVTFFKRLNIQLLVAVGLCVPGILISYTLLGKNLIKQGLTIDNKQENSKVNSKKSVNKAKKESNKKKNSTKKKGNDK